MLDQAAHSLVHFSLIEHHQEGDLPHDGAVWRRLGEAVVEKCDEALPAHAPERAVAEKILLKFQRFLEDQPHQTPTEQEFIKAMLKTWEDARAEGHAAGSAHTRAHDLLTVLQARRIPISAAARKRILEQKNLKHLERWLKRASIATSLDEVLGSRT